MSKNIVGIIFNEDGQQRALAFDASASVPADSLIQKEPVGPFLIQASLQPYYDEITAKVDPVTIDMLAATTESSIHCLVKKLPIFLRTKLEWSLNGMKGRFLNATKDGQVWSGVLQADKIPKGDYFYLRFSQQEIVTCMWDSQENRCYNVPFYNFQSDGSSCLGSSQAGAKSNFEKLLGFLNAFTQPHNTYGGDGEFHLVDETGESAKMSEEEIEKNGVDFNAMKMQFTYEPEYSWPEQVAIGAFKVPSVLTDAKKRAKPIGKLTPFI